MQLRGNEASESQQVDLLKNTSTLKKKKASGWNELPHRLWLGWWAGRHPGSRDVELQGANFMHCSYNFDYNYTSIHVANISETSNIFPPSSHHGVCAVKKPGEEETTTPQGLPSSPS